MTNNNSVYAEAASMIDLNGFAEETHGGVDEGGYYALVRVTTSTLLNLASHQEDQDLINRFVVACQQDSFDLSLDLWVVLTIDDQGFKSALTVTTDQPTAERVWEVMVEESDTEEQSSSDRLASMIPVLEATDKVLHSKKKG